MSEHKKVTFSKEELAARVKVPAVVEQDLKRIITDRLEQCGLYFRVFSRIKTPGSISRKFELKDYGEERKIQDLVGLRINLYFDEDMEICKSIMEHTFQLLEWSTSQRSNEEFKPTKLNGVFRLPGYLRSQISSDTWEMYIDQTFEVQIKTMFFEGWHEIEHDMRYKGEELWKDYGAFSRYLNSILATLELCDKSMINLFDDLGHELYKNSQWSGMIKSHFRLKMRSFTLYPEIEQFLDQDRETGSNIGKKIYKTPKKTLVDLLLKRSKRVPINANTIIALLNDNIFQDETLRALLRSRDVYNDGREESVGESRHYELRPLIRNNVFQMCTEVDGNRIKCEEPITSRMIFERSAEYIYRWVVKKYEMLFNDMPSEVSSYRADILAYHVTINYDRENCHMNMHVRHMDMEVGGRIWYSEASLEENEAGKIYLRVSNGYAEPDRENRYYQDSNAFFSYPGYYKDIVSNVGIKNGLPCQNKRRLLREEQIPSIVSALNDPGRLFPVVLIVSKSSPDGMMDEDWLEQFRVSDFTRTVWRYAHVITSYEENGRKLLDAAGVKEIEVPQLYILWPGGKVDRYGPEDVENCQFGRHLESRADARTYDIVHGGQAFYHKLVTLLRDWNVSVSMWEGFKLEILTEIPE